MLISDFCLLLQLCVFVINFQLQNAIKIVDVDLVIVIVCGQVVNESCGLVEYDGLFGSVVVCFCVNAAVGIEVVSKLLLGLPDFLFITFMLVALTCN